MNQIVTDFSEKVGPIKIMNAVNNGPLPVTKERTRSNFSDYKALRIPYARTHDASFCAAYGGEHTVDVNFIFPDFDADENDPNSYDFTLTDEYLKTMFDAGTEPFFRLGSKIEHWSKKYNTRVPKNFSKWARICEHIIAHYTEGWAKGFRRNITYWEIWNEADGRPDEAPPEMKECWGGTMMEFFLFYKTVATHLKSRFPHLKIGGPACCSVDVGRPFFRVVIQPWLDAFLRFLRDNNVPLDFFSWHGYNVRVESFMESAVRARAYLDKYGFNKTESILNEWNYLEGWNGERFINTIKNITGMRGASYIAAMMIGCQNAPVDMLMYYDARPSIFNGMFDYYTQKPLKGYYPFALFSRLAEMGTQVKSTCSGQGIYALAAAGKGKKGILISYYPFRGKGKEKKVIISSDIHVKNALLLDEDNTLVPQQKYEYASKEIIVTLKPHSVLYLEGV